MPALTPTEVAAALYNDGRRPVNSDRILKAIRHIDSREAFEAMLAALPESVRAYVFEVADPLVRQKVGA